MCFWCLVCLILGVVDVVRSFFLVVAVVGEQPLVGVDAGADDREDGGDNDHDFTTIVIVIIQCPRCTDPTEFGTMTSGLPCNACSTGLLLPTDSESASASASESCPSWSCSKCGKRCPAKQVEERERILVNNPLHFFLFSFSLPDTITSMTLN